MSVSTQMVILMILLLLGRGVGVQQGFFLGLISGDVFFESLGTLTVRRFFVVMLRPFRQLPE